VKPVLSLKVLIEPLKLLSKHVEERVGSLRAEKRPDYAFLRTITKLGTDVPLLTPNTFRRGAPKIPPLGGGGKGNYVQLIALAMTRLIESCLDACYFRRNTKRSTDVSWVTPNGR